MDASSISVMMLSIDVSAPSRPLLDAYRSDPARRSEPAIAARGVGTITVERETFKQLQLDFYREAASRYDSWAGGANVRAAQRLAEFAAVQDGERVIDVGCGTGLISRSLGESRSPLEHLAIDLSPDMITVARELTGSAANTRYVVMDAHDLVFHDSMFDVAMLGQSLACLEDPWRALAEVRRVLTPHGRIAVCCRCRSLSTPAQEVFFERLERLAIRRPRTPAHHALFGEPWVLTQMLEAAGFTDICVTQLLVGVRAQDVHAWTEMMQWSGPWTHAMFGLLSPGSRATFEEELDLTMHRLGEGDYAFHAAFTLACGRRRDETADQASSAPENTADVSAATSALSESAPDSP
jgi:ubiquinone/menaquinone biosynthesis C-methylase UbiE